MLIVDWIYLVKKNT